MIQVQLKLILRPTQERQLRRWLWHLTAVYNWAIRKIELDSADGIYHTRYGLESLVKGHAVRLGIAGVAVEDTIRTAHDAWRRCFKGLARKPHLRGRRNKLNSLSSHHAFQRPTGRRLRFPVLGPLKFHRQVIPEGRIKCGRIVRRASGWYLCLFIEAPTRSIPVAATGEIGIDPGFLSLLALSSGEKVEHPRELQRTSERLGQAQRGVNRRLVARLLERQRNQRRDRNHKLSRRLVSENALIAWSTDNHRAIARRFGKSVASSAHGQLREMLSYKSRAGGRTFIQVSPKHSTVTCSACGARSGPSGFAGLSVRQWRCGCGAEHDRDVNAAVNTLHAARRARVERAREGTPVNRRVGKMAKSDPSIPRTSRGIHLNV